MNCYTCDYGNARIGENCPRCGNYNRPFGDPKLAESGRQVLGASGKLLVFFLMISAGWAAWNAESWGSKIGLGVIAFGLSRLVVKLK